MVDVHDRCVPALIALNPQGPHAILTHVLEVHRLDRVIETRTGHNRASRSRLDLVPRQFERPHDCLRPSDCNEGINALSTLADLLRQGASDHSSNCCLLSTNRHGAPHNVLQSVERLTTFLNAYSPSPVSPRGRTALHDAMLRAALRAAGAAQ